MISLSFKGLCIVLRPPIDTALINLNDDRGWCLVFCDMVQKVVWSYLLRPNPNIRRCLITEQIGVHEADVAICIRSLDHQLCHS